MNKSEYNQKNNHYFYSFLVITIKTIVYLNNIEYTLITGGNKNDS